MKFLLSIPADDTRKEWSKTVELPSLPVVGQAIQEGQCRIVVREIVFVADSDEIQVVCNTHTRMDEPLLKKRGWTNTNDEPYFEKQEPEKKGKRS